MKNLPALPIVFAAMVFAACAHQSPKPAAVAELDRLSCLAPALSAYQLLPEGVSDEETKKVVFANYTSAFLDAKEVMEYLACLDKEPDGPDRARETKEARQWLANAQKEIEKDAATFPPEKRIVNIEETFSDLPGNRGRARVVATLRDGTRNVSETDFDKAAP